MIFGPNAGLSNPMTATGDIIYSSDNLGTPAKLGVGSNGNVLKLAAGIPSWGSASANLTYRSVTTTDAPTNADDVLACSSSSFTITLFTAVGNEGKVLEISHNGTSLTQAYTLNTTSGQTIGGYASGAVVLYTNGEVFRIFSDGANWQIFEHYAMTPEVSAGATVLSATSAYVFTVTAANATIGDVYSNNGQTFIVSITIAAGVTLTCSGTGTPAASGTLTKVSGSGDATIVFASRTITGVPVKGTVGTDLTTYTRQGRFSEFTVQLNQTGAGTSGVGDYVWTFPAGLTLDTTNITTYKVLNVNSALQPSNSLGTVSIYSSSGPTITVCNVVAYDATHFRLHSCNSFIFMGSSGNIALGAATITVTGRFRMPVLGWIP